MTTKRALSSLLVCSVLLLGMGVAADAQSGRRIPKRTEPAPLPHPSEPEQPTNPPPSKPDKPQLSVLVVNDISHVDVSSGFYYDIVLNSCVERLKESYGVKVTAGSEMNRKEAQDRAKASQDTYVTWIELGVEGPNAGRGMGSSNPNDLFVYFTLFTPGTGKIKTQGRVYLAQMVRTGDVGLGLPVPPNIRSVDYLYRKAGRETADRVLRSLGLAAPPGR